MSAARGDLRVQRWAPAAIVIPFEGIDLTGATFAMQVRQYPDTPGAAMIDLTNSVAPAQGISVAVVTVDALPVSTVTIHIDETTIEGLLPFPANGTEPGDDVVLAYDLVITVTGLSKRRWLQGAFLIEPGVTQ